MSSAIGRCAAPGVRPGGWAFQYNNDHYPDVDDTAVVVMAMDRLDPARYKESIDRAVEWIFGLQSKNGGWGAFDVDNEYYYLNHIPFADHGALLDPPTADVSRAASRCWRSSATRCDHPKVKAAVDLSAAVSRRRTAPGSAAGAPIISTVPGRYSAR